MPFRCWACDQFPRHFVRGPIEAFAVSRRPPPPNTNFHVILYVAPLKQVVRSDEGGRKGTFPRHFVRGPIEARMSKLTAHSRQKFPRHFVRGPIEASQNTPIVQKSAGNFHVILYVAPLKRPERGKDVASVSHFHVILYVAPLKRGRRPSRRAGRRRFPRHFVRGPIEAMCVRTEKNRTKVISTSFCTWPH